METQGFATGPPTVDFSEQYKHVRASSWRKSQVTARTLAIIFLSIAMATWLASFIWFLVDTFESKDEKIDADDDGKCDCQKEIQKKLKGPMILFFAGCGLILILVIAVIIVFAKHAAYTTQLAHRADAQVRKSVFGEESKE